MSTFVSRPWHDRAGASMVGHDDFMRQAITEARRGEGRTRPNPMVGCVVVRRGKIIARGHHAKAGSAHAEIVALRRAGRQARGADVYVTLEPCNHQGRTGPCCDALVAAGVKRVFVGSRDPNPLVNGRGIRCLRRAGIDVLVGRAAAAECQELNAPFAVFMREGRPYVIAKMGQSLDGRIATHTGESQWITGVQARRHSHQLRNRVDAIAVGVGTVLADNPKLTCRGVRGGRDPIRVVFDSEARTPTRAAIITEAAAAGAAPTIVVVGPHAPAARCRKLERCSGVTLLGGTSAGDTHASAGKGNDSRGLRPNLTHALKTLASEFQIVTLLVEGGPTLLGACLDNGCIDYVKAFVAPRIIGGDQAHCAVGGTGAPTLADTLDLAQPRVSQLGRDLLIEGRIRRS